MTGIKNLEGYSDKEISFELQNGAKFVIFQYCVSIIIMTFRRNSNIYFIKNGESTLKHSIRYTLMSLFFGWWGIPWGPIYTLGSIFNNLNGGKDVTAEIMKSLNNPNANQTSQSSQATQL